MNAYELADAITNCTTDPLHNNVANMLRQQADRIAELEVYENTIKAWTWDKEKQQYVPPLQKQSEPVAWMYVNDDGECEEISYGMPYIQDPDIQLLYTTPQTKPLSDEEIEQVMMKVGYGEVHKFVNPFDFARAIEAKVRGEK
jgi:hypothetical protein